MQNIQDLNEQELVVLVNENDEPMGTMRKDKVHNKNTPLHRGLSVFLFDKQGKVLVQQRARHKLTWPGVWSNSCCGHPKPKESYEKAALREVKEELGLEVKDFIKVSDYRYRFKRIGVVENEICPVFMGIASGEVRLDPNEVADFKWMEWNEFREELTKDGVGKWSEWCKEEVGLVERKIRQLKRKWVDIYD
jgi:isopentenyl-diphosphate delta-isomerase